MNWISRHVKLLQALAAIAAICAATYNLGRPAYRVAFGEPPLIVYGAKLGADYQQTFDWIIANGGIYDTSILDRMPQVSTVFVGRPFVVVYDFEKTRGNDDCSVIKYRIQAESEHGSLFGIKIVGDVDISQMNLPVGRRLAPVPIIAAQTNPPGKYKLISYLQFGCSQGRLVDIPFPDIDFTLEAE